MKNVVKLNIWIVLIAVTFVLATSCGEKRQTDERFSTPVKTYAIWLDTAVKGDYAANIECVTKASVKFMDSMAKHRTVFMERMMAAAKLYDTYDILDENIKGVKAVVVLSEPQSGQSIAVPFLYEDDGWKVDLITMFSGMVKG